jgi:hypothetical protein
MFPVPETLPSAQSPALVFCELMEPMRPEHEPSEDGVDVSLIRWMINLTPSERLDALQGFVDSVVELRRGRRET